MPYVEIELLAGIREPVEFGGQFALVVSWRVVRPRLFPGGSLDRAAQMLL